MDIAFKVFSDLVVRLGLRPEHRVLDVGCGIGRMAYPLAYFLSAKGSYEGFDIMRDAIAWAQGAIGARFPNFRFRHVDIRNTRYNKTGTLTSAQFAFPYENASFDRLFLNSVFTHMLDFEVEHYLDEFARVLAPGGRAYITCFLHDQEARKLIESGRSKEPQVHRLGAGFVVDPQVPEASIGFPREWMLERMERRGLRVERVLPGGWCGRPGWIGYQDIVLVRRA